jgi:hypothetical protein
MRVEVVGYAVVLGHVAAMTPMSHWAMRASSGFLIDQNQDC